MFNATKPSEEKDSFLKQAEISRQQRQLEKKKLNSAILIQSVYRGYRTRKKLFDELNSDVRGQLNGLRDENGQIKLKLSPIKIYSLVGKFLYLTNKIDKEMRTFRRNNSKRKLNKSTTSSGSSPVKPSQIDSSVSCFF